MKYYQNNLKPRATQLYSKTYSHIIGLYKIIYTYFQDLTNGQNAPAAPDQPIKASSTYRLVRSSRSLILNLRDIYAIN
jgi:hypothetical protein